MTLPVCVIIPAFNAQATIDRAVASALAPPEVAEVLVLDDCSVDAAADTAMRAEGGPARLTLMRLGRNRGPSVARNPAIASSRFPLIAILDADNLSPEGRFTPPTDGEEAALVERNSASIQAKYHHHLFLGDKADLGLMAALPSMVVRPVALARVAPAVVRDKTGHRSRATQGTIRLLLSAREFDRAAYRQTAARNVR